MVEDCRRLADLVAEGLSDQGIVTDVAYDGTAAALKLDHNAYDVVVLDRAVPGVHGDALCQRIARTEGRRHGPHAEWLGVSRRPDRLGWASAPTTTWGNRSTFPS